MCLEWNVGALHMDRYHKNSMLNNMQNAMINISNSSMLIYYHMSLVNILEIKQLSIFVGNHPDRFLSDQMRKSQAVWLP